MNVALQLAEKDAFSSGDAMSRWLDRVLGPNYQHLRSRGQWRPAINLYEDSGSFFMVADLAGVSPEDIDLQLEDRTLTLRGTRPSPRPPAGTPACSRDDRAALRVHLMEIDEGEFVRKLELPANVVSENIEACYRNGLLWIKMPKRG